MEQQSKRNRVFFVVFGFFFGLIVVARLSGMIHGTGDHECTAIQGLSEGFKWVRKLSKLASPAVSRIPQVGSQHQAVIPTLTNQRSPAEALPANSMWVPSQSPSEIDTYLEDVQGLFEPSDDHFSEERALLLLYRCNYDHDLAMRLLIPSMSNQLRTEDGDEECFICGDGGHLLICEADGCGKVYHLACVQLDESPQGEWKCPRHFCSQCRVEDVVLRCAKCSVSFCSRHVPFERASTSGFVCLNCERPSSSHEHKQFLLLLLQILQSSTFLMEPSELYTLYEEVQVRGGIRKAVEAGTWKRLRACVVDRTDHQIHGKLHDLSGARLQTSDDSNSTDTSVSPQSRTEGKSHHKKRHRIESTGSSKSHKKKLYSEVQSPVQNTHASSIKKSQKKKIDREDQPLSKLLKGNTSVAKSRDSDTEDEPLSRLLSENRASSKLKS